MNTKTSPDRVKPSRLAGARIDGTVLEAFAPGTTENGETEVKLGIEYLHRCHDTDPDIANFVHVVKLAVAADEVDTWVTSEAVAHDLQLDGESCMKLG